MSLDDDDNNEINNSKKIFLINILKNLRMKKILFCSALAAVALASCSSDDFMGDTSGSNPSAATAKEISFSGEAGKTTRAEKKDGDAASALGNNFVVFGTKNVDNTDKTVYNNYTVAFNNSKWDYVGTFGEKNQTIKYWDYSASKYDFIAYSLGKGTTKATASSITSTGYTLTGSAEALAGCYIADKVTVKKEDFQKAVTIKFYSLAAKVTIGIFEIIPGYSVKDVKFYANGTETSPSATAPTLYANSNTIPTSNAGNQMKVTYTADTNKPTIKFDENVSTANSITFGALSMNDNKLGTTNPTASKPATSNTVLPANVGALTLKVDYTLVSEDGSGEEINVKGTTAVVPSTFTNWEANHAYTYIFKITDKTNGTTGGSDDSAGLYPITFDAVVTETEIGNQETITVMNQPSITTYAKETSGNEYKAGNIYVSTSDTENLTLGTAENQTSNCALYTVTTTGSYPATEALVEQCLAQQGTGVSKTLKIGNNTITVTKSDDLSIVSSIDATDTSDGKAISGNFAKFTATANTIYAFEYTKTSTTGNEGGTKTTKYYKVIKVEN